MDTCYIDISDYIPDPVVEAVDRAIRELEKYGLREEYNIIPAEGYK